MLKLKSVFGLWSFGSNSLKDLVHIRVRSYRMESKSIGQCLGIAQKLATNLSRREIFVPLLKAKREREI